MRAVAGLFQKTLLSRRRSAPESLEAYRAELFLHHPWYDPELASRVYVSPDGALRGFIGVLPLHLCFRGRENPACLARAAVVGQTEVRLLAAARGLCDFASTPPRVVIVAKARS